MVMSCQRAKALQHTSPYSKQAVHEKPAASVEKHIPTLQPAGFNKTYARGPVFSKEFSPFASYQSAYNFQRFMYSLAAGLAAGQGTEILSDPADHSRCTPLPAGSRAEIRVLQKMLTQNVPPRVPSFIPHHCLGYLSFVLCIKPSLWNLAACCRSEQVYITSAGSQAETRALQKMLAKTLPPPGPFFHLTSLPWTPQPFASHQAQPVRLCVAFCRSEQVYIASAGFQADIRALQKMLQTRNVMYQHIHRKPMSASALAQLLGNNLYYKRFFPYFTWNLCVGLDPEGMLCSKSSTTSASSPTSPGTSALAWTLEVCSSSKASTRRVLLPLYSKAPDRGQGKGKLQSQRASKTNSLTDLHTNDTGPLYRLKARHRLKSTSGLLGNNL